MALLDGAGRVSLTYRGASPLLVVIDVFACQVSINALVVRSSCISEIDRAEVPLEPFPCHLQLCFSPQRRSLPGITPTAKMLFKRKSDQLRGRRVRFLRLALNRSIHFIAQFNSQGLAHHS